MAIKGALPGQYACIVLPSRRNSFNHALNDDTHLMAHLRRIGRSLDPKFTLEMNTPCLKMLAGVLLNGHK